MKCRWRKNGDHPADDCEMIYPGSDCQHKPFLSEGKVVRRFRDPRHSGTEPCLLCGKPLHVHGWIDSGGEGQKVCPGDFVVEAPEGYRVEHTSQEEHDDG